MNEIVCIECGSAPVDHRSEWWSNWFEHWSHRYSRPLEYFRRGVQPILSALPWNGIGLAALHGARLVRLVTFHDELLPDDNSRTLVLWEAARRKGIKVTRVSLLGQKTEISIAEYQGSRRVYMSLPRPKGAPSNAMFWMDNKAMMQKELNQAGIPVPRSFECSTEEQSLAAFRQLRSAAIVKPTYGSRSRHTTVGITNEEQMARAFHVAQEISQWVMVQEELPGFVHRVLWVGDEVVAVMRREPAYVTGDGNRTIRELAEEENKNPTRHGPIFHELPTDDNATNYLAGQGLDWGAVLPVGTIAVLNPKVSRGNGAVNVDVTDEVHPENMKLFKKIGSVVNDPLVGIDFIIRDITLPWQEQLPCGVIECNALPYVDLHAYPFSGPVRDAASALWDIVFSNIKSSE